MKKALFALLALAFCLSACAPAAAVPESEAVPAAETAETAPVEATAFQVGGLRGNGSMNDSGSAWYRIGSEPGTDGYAKAHVLKLDYAAAREDLIYTFPEPVLETSGVIAQKDAVYVIADQTLYKISADGSEVQTLPLAEGFYALAADEYSAYDYSFAMEENTYKGRRLDLATGQITDLNLPALTWDLWAVGEDRFLICRLITQAPLPNRDTESEIFSAVLQNAVCEYNWYDPATGALEKILEEPYDGAEQPDGSRRIHRFLGLRDGRMYFSWTVSGEDGSTLDAGMDSCTLQGEDWQPLSAMDRGQELSHGLWQNNQLRWIVGYNNQGAWIFDMKDESFHEPVDLVSAWPDAFLEDGRVLLQTSYEDAQGNYHVAHALVDAQAYLDGTAELTPVESEAAKTLF